MFKALPTPSEMHLWDSNAVKLGIPEFSLMENASREALKYLIDKFHNLGNLNILIFMGAGNNGGDAVCLARHLNDLGSNVIIVHTRAFDKYKGVTKEHLDLALKCNLKFIPSLDIHDKIYEKDFFDFLSADIIIDGLLGTGFRGELGQHERDLIELINTLGKKSFVLSLDIPSGLCGLSGNALPIAVKANACVSFAALKLGMATPNAKQFCDELIVCDIGIPNICKSPTSSLLITDNILSLRYDKAINSHKGSHGHVLVISGIQGLLGASRLAALAAMRSGAGLVTIGGKADTLSSISPDIMSKEIDFEFLSELEIQSLFEAYDSVAVGMGLGQNEYSHRILCKILNLKQRPPLIIDADALKLLADNKDLFSLIRYNDVLTPHPGEAAKLLKTSSKQIQENRLRSLESLKALCGCIWVLKGACTMIGKKTKPNAVCDIDAPNLAVGGSGDVLAGCIASFVAQGLDSMNAACLAVYMHAKAGLLLSKNYEHRGNLPSDIADYLAKI